MPYLDELIRQTQIALQQPVGADLGLRRGQAYASYYPNYEVTTPQYTVPNAWTLAQMGYRTNEVIYACIAKRAKAIAQARLMEYKDNLDDDKEPEEVNGSPIRKLLRKANQGIGEKMFWQIHETMKAIAGFCAWEVETNMIGEPIRLWLMNPVYCSFMRGEQKPVRAIRYQPYGLPPQDIPIERVILDGFFDPLYPQIRFYSPTMNALSQLKVDNNMTDFLADFVQHGAKFSGLLSVAQTIDDTIAQDYKRRFRDAHGGTQNWSDPLVLGLGAKYETMQMDFKDMAFPELDARTETRICQSFEISPILIAAKVGLERATLNNYKEAKDAWYDEWVIPEWELTSDVVGQQLLSFYYENPEDYYCKFDTKGVRTLTENRTEQVSRAIQMFTSNLAKLNEAREEAGLDPEEDGDKFKSDISMDNMEEQAARGIGFTPKDKQDNGKDKPEPPDSFAERQKKEKDTKAQEEEIKNFRAFARRRIKEGKTGDIPLFEFKHVDPEQAVELIRAATAEAVTGKLDEILNKE